MRTRINLYQKHTRSFATMSFPKGFIWGTATAAYQIEGAAFDEGKGLSVWDMMCKREGAIRNGDKGDVACDHYHLYQKDIDMLAELGVGAYRFSLSWPRLLPEGRGRVNQAGLDFYNRLIDAILAKGIEPYVTIFHWDYPYALFQQGGWLNPDCTAWFAEYTELVVKHFSDRVKHWFTLNEPECFIIIGHKEGRHAPGLKLGSAEIIQAIHNALLTHGTAVQIIRDQAKQKPDIGIAFVANAPLPLTNSEADIEAAREEMFTVKNEDHCFCSAWWIDPIVKGQYPAEVCKFFEKYRIPVKTEDLKIISTPVDFIGHNTYQGYYVRRNENHQTERLPRAPGHPRSSFHWEVTPEILYWTPRFLYERYQIPLLTSENGFANLDWVMNDGKVHDPQRVDYLQINLKQLKKAIADGVNVRGYFYWTLMDNFEWAEGYNERFGLIHVDFLTQKRTFKDSAHYYKQLVVNNGATL